MALKIAGSLGIAIRRVQLDAAKLLQVSRLRVNEQLIDRGHLDIGDQSQIHSHPHAGEQHHGFFAADRLGRAENSKSSADSIVQILLTLFDQEFPSATFIIDHHGNDFRDLFD